MRRGVGGEREVAIRDVVLAKIDEWHSVSSVGRLVRMYTLKGQTKR